MVLIGLIFATGFRKKRAILVPPHPWSIFVNISAVLKTSKTFNTKNIWMRFTLKCWCTGDILWYLVSSGQHHSCLAGENCRSGGAQHLLITLRRSFWYEVGGILMLFFFFFKFCFSCSTFDTWLVGLLVLAFKTDEGLFSTCNCRDEWWHVFVLFCWGMRVSLF